MEKRKTGFWRGFTWKRMLKNFLYIFLLTQFVDLLFNAQEPGKSFQADLLLRRFITCTVLAFLFAFWHEPGVDDKGRDDQRIA